jgi:Uma2 family endonuclease
MLNPMSPAPPITAAELERLYLPNKQVELVRGQLVVCEPPGTWHGRIAANLTLSLGGFVKQQGLGVVFAQDTGFQIAADPDTVRGADVAFVGTNEMHRIPRRGFAELAPDLVAEVLSPDDRPGDALAKVAEWLGAGTTLVWVIDPQRTEARVYRADGTVSIVQQDGTLDGEAVVPGFNCALREVLP